MKLKNAVTKHKVAWTTSLIVAALATTGVLIVQRNDSSLATDLSITAVKTGPSIPLPHPKGYVALVFTGGPDANVTWQILNALDKRHATATFGVTYPKDLSGLNSVVREAREGMSVCQPADVAKLKVTDTGDTASADQQVTSGVKGAKPGSIILLRDGSVKGYEATAKTGLSTALAVSGLVRELRARNLEPGVLDGCTGKVVAGHYTGPN